MIWEYVILAVLLIIIAMVAFKVTRKDFDEEMNKLVQYLGGRDNIIDCEMSMSRFKVTLRDVSKANKDEIRLDDILMNKIDKKLPDDRKLFEIPLSLDIDLSNLL